jgi:TonB family protein
MAFFGTVLSLCALPATGQEARKALSKPQPVYPELARQLKLAGAVKIELVVATDGKIKDTKVVGGHPMLVEAALKAVRDANRTCKQIVAVRDFPVPTLR